MNSDTTLPAQTENLPLKYVFLLQKAHKEIYNGRFTVIYLYKLYFLYFDKNSLLLVYVQYDSKTLALFTKPTSILRVLFLTLTTLKRRRNIHENHMSNSRNRTYLSMYLHEN